MRLRVNHFGAAGGANFLAIRRFLVVLLEFPNKSLDGLQLLRIAVSKAILEAAGESSHFPTFPAFMDSLFRFPFKPVKIFGRSFPMVRKGYL
jgi:hypothetical protein